MSRYKEGKIKNNIFLMSPGKPLPIQLFTSQQKDAMDKKKHSIEKRKDKELIPVVNLSIMGRKVENIMDSGRK